MTPGRWYKPRHDFKYFKKNVPYKCVGTFWIQFVLVNDNGKLDKVPFITSFDFVPASDAEVLGKILSCKYNPATS